MFQKIYVNSSLLLKFSNVALFFCVRLWICVIWYLILHILLCEFFNLFIGILNFVNIYVYFWGNVFFAIFLKIFPNTYPIFDFKNWNITVVFSFLPRIGTRISGSTGTGNRRHIFRLNQGKPEPEKNVAFQPEPPGNFAIEQEKPPG